MTDENKTCTLKLDSDLDETTQLSCDPADHHEILIVDFDSVTFINSSGIGLWVIFIAALQERSNIKQVIFKNAHRLIINQVNSVRDFLPAGGSIESFYLPLYCNKCNKQFNNLFETSSFDASKVDDLESLNLKIDCNEYPSCIDEIEIDAIPKKYLNFLKPGS